MSTKRKLSPKLPWRSWLPYRIQLRRDEHGQVCAVRTFKDGSVVDLELGAVIIRTQPHATSPDLNEWTVHASVSRHSEEAKAALALIQNSLELIEELQKELTRNEIEGGGVSSGRRTVPGKKEQSILNFVVTGFLLVEPLSHPELAKLYPPEIINLIRTNPELADRLHLLN